MTGIPSKRLLTTAVVASLAFAGGCGGGSGDSATPAASLAQAEKSYAITSVDPNTVQLSKDAAAEADTVAKTYIVRLRDDALSSYAGGVGSFKATAPAAGQKLDAGSTDALAYKAHLESQHSKVVASVGARKTRSYTAAMNGFSAVMTSAQAAKLKSHPDVLNVWPEEFREINTNFSNDFLELDDPGAGLRANRGLTGKGIVIGVIDTGIARPKEHPSLRDDRGFGRPPGWKGICEAGENFSADDCNNKVIGARFYVDGFVAGGPLDEDDYISPLDFSDHGTHTATTAGGNRVDDAQLSGIDVGTVSGMAPDAWLSVYKTCWRRPGAPTFSCALSDLVAAIDQATADGVDVINYSIGSTAPGYGADDFAFLGAVNAGVFVATSAGNAGPGSETVGSPANPWIASVGASTRTGITTALALAVNSPAAVAGQYAALEGAITQPLEESGVITNDLKAAEPLLACEPLTNDLTGFVAFIERGTCAFTTKVENAVDAGAIGVVLFTDAREKTVMGGATTDKTSSVPGVMIDREPGLAILAELSNGPVNVTLGPLGPGNSIDDPIEGNVMATFSSRGANRTALDIVKPDVTAPGVNILAGYSVDGETGQEYGYLSGTSMSSPHVAGIGALLIEANPQWTPSEVKSALMTSARQNVVKEDDTTPADPFDFGAGHIVPNDAVDPGMLYPANFRDYEAFLCDAVPSEVDPNRCNVYARQGKSTDASDLNYPSIGIAALVDSQTVTRRVRNASGRGRTTYTVSVDAPPGIDVVVNPSTLTLSGKSERSFDVTFTVTDDAVLTQWAFGSLTWSDGTREVRSPIAVRPFGLSFDASVEGAGESGSTTVNVKTGFNGDYTAGAHGMVAPLKLAGTVADDPNNEFEFLGPGTDFQVINVPPGTALLRASLFNESVSGNSDLDLYAYYCPGFACGGIVAQSGNPDSNEQVDILFPDPGFWVVFIHGFQTENGEPSTYELNAWGVSADPAADDGSLAVNGQDVATVIPANRGDEIALDVTWSGLAPDRNVGAVSHFSPGGLEGLTIVEVDAR
jgi:subtilisin family serine protease